jgi:disulfide bond formation protein DsbB
MTLPISRRLANTLGFLACAGLMAYALYAEFVLHYEPCPLCIFQRVAVIATGIVFLIAAIHGPGMRGARIYGSLALLTTLAGLGVAGRHIWTQMQPPGTVPSCGAGLNFLLEINPLWDVIKKVLTASGECGTIDWTFLGLSMPWWVAISLGALLIWDVMVNFLLSADARRK